MIKIFGCGYCKKDIGTRHDLRKHLRKEHIIKEDMASFEHNKKGTVYQAWWKWREFK